MKINFKTILFFSLFFSFYQCEVPFEDNARLLIKGSVFDENNNPLQNTEVGVYVRRDTDFGSSSGGQLLGEGITEANGDFSIITLFGRDDNFVVEVITDNNYTNYVYKTSTEEFTPTDFLINLETVPVRRIATTDFNITRTSQIGTEIQYSVEFQDTFCREVFIEEVFEETQTTCYEINFFQGLLNDARPDRSFNFSSLLNSEIIFRYSINGQPEETQILTIDQPNYEFNFSY